MSDEPASVDQQRLLGRLGVNGSAFDTDSTLITIRTLSIVPAMLNASRKNKNDANRHSQPTICHATSRR